MRSWAAVKRAAASHIGPEVSLTRPQGRTGPVSGTRGACANVRVVMAPRKSVLVLFLVLAGCGDRAMDHVSAPETAPSTTHAPSTTSAAPPADATAGDTSGPPFGWESIRVLGTSGLDIGTVGCDGIVGATADITDRIVVTAYKHKRGGPATLVPSCPPRRVTFRLDLPEPAGGRPIVNPTDPERQPPVAWDQPSKKGNEVTIRLPDPSCSGVANVITVEGPTSVSLTAWVVDTGTPGCRDGMDPHRSYTVALADPGRGRSLVDGRSGYGG